MRIFTVENTAYEMNEIPDEVEDLRFCVLDNSNPKDPDYFFIPLIFLESFSEPALVLKIGEAHIKMPVDWHILIGEPEAGELEVVPLKHVNDRGFKAFAHNPLDNKRPSFLEIEVADIFQEVKWYFPKLKPGQLLAVPLTDGPEPKCAFFVKDISRQFEVVDFSEVW